MTKILTEKVMLRKDTLGCQCGLLSPDGINSAPGCAVLFLISKLAARLGVEPRQNESESFVLPLHHRAVTGARRAGIFFALHRQRTGAGDGIRTRNRLFTKQVLYR